jgi:DNA-binding CsgD family transcriptional regulator
MARPKKNVDPEIDEKKDERPTTRQLIDRMWEESSPYERMDKLTDMQMYCVLARAAGYTDLEVATMTGTTHQNVRNHISNARFRLGINHLKRGNAVIGVMAVRYVMAMKRPGRKPAEWQAYLDPDPLSEETTFEDDLA